MGDRQYRPQGYARPSYGDDRNDRNERYPRDTRYAYDDRYDRYDRDDRYERPRSQSPPRRTYERFDDRRNDYGRNDDYTFRGAADRGSTYRAQRPQEEFTFQSNGPSAPHFPPQQRPPPGPAPQPAHPRIKRPRREHAKRGPAVPYGEQMPGAGPRGRFRKPPPHQRDILRRQAGSSTPEQLHGMNEEGQSRFNANFSSSEDQGSEDGEIEDDVVNDEGPRKRVKTDVTGPDEQTAPKWSNPEYFTALPPPETGPGPKKDIVQVIRKAKVEAAAKQDSTSNAVKENADFISFSMDDDILKVSDEDSDVEILPSANQPSGPAKLGNHTVTKPEDDPAPKKRPFKQFVRPRSPVLNFSLRPSYKTKNPVGPPPQPPASIDQLMSMADRMQVSGKRKTQPHPIQEYKPELYPPAQPVPPQKVIPQKSSESKGKKRKADKISKGLGDVALEWVRNETNPTPWCTVDHSRTANVGLRLHKEIADFNEFVRPHDYEEAVRHDLVERVQRCVQSWRPDSKNVQIRSFGSFASGVYLPTADMDLVAVSPAYLQNGRKTFCQTNSQMHNLGRRLQNDNIVLDGSLTVITRAKVPIIKFTDKKTGIKVDISLENDTGLIALQTFAEWKEKYPAMSVIVVLIKQMLAMRNLNEVFLGGLGGFSIICLVVSVMQHMPEIQSGSMDPSLHYGDLLLNFLDLYGNKFNVRTTGITMEPPGYFDKVNNPHRKQNTNGLTIIDPNKLDNDISGGSNKILIVFNCFRTAYSEIQRRLAEIYSRENVEESILGCVLAGNYTSFIKQRNRLKLLHQEPSMGPISVADEDDYEIDLAEANLPKPNKKGKPKPPRAGRANRAGPLPGGPLPNNRFAPPAHLPARPPTNVPSYTQAPMAATHQRPQRNQKKHLPPKPPAPSGTYHAPSKRRN